MKSPIQKKDVLRYTFKKKGMFLVSRKMTIPNGLKIEKDIILHPGAALIVPFLSRDKIVIIRQYRSTLKKYLYEFPAGTLEPGETPQVCARREIMEEAGYRAGKLTRMGMIYPVVGYSDEIITIYKAEKLTPQKNDGDADEVLESLVITRAKLRELFRQGQIVDAKTIAGLAFCGLLK